MGKVLVLRGWLLDMVLAAVVGGAMLLGAYAVAGPGPGLLDRLLIVAGSLALVGHRRHSLPVLAVTTGCMVGYVVHGEPGSWAAFPVLAAVHAAARGGHRAAGVAASALFLMVFVGADPLSAGMVERTLLLVGWFLCAGITGLMDKNWQAYLRQSELRAAEAERGKEEAALRRAGEERLQIARELHDSLTHSISIVKLQAGVAVHLARKRGEEVPPALLAIQEASGEAMRELRSTLDVLRTDVGPAGTGLDRLEELIERARAAGVPVAVTVDAPALPLPADVDRAAYRIVQEALTNVARHADRASTEVVLAHGGLLLLVEVTDEGPATPGEPVVEGVGLTGIRERVAALGGTVEAGPRTTGGFTVRAELPLAR